MRGATEVTLQHHQILRLPRKMTLMIDPRHIWNVIYTARSHRGDPPTSPNTVPATQNDSHDWSASHMRRYLQCAEQRLPSNITKYCACHAKWLSWLIRVTYETLFTMRGATKVTLQHHQILRLQRKMTLMIDPRHIWNVIYKQSNRGDPPTSANIAPATQNRSHDWSAPHMKRYLQCAEQQRLASNITKYCACHKRMTLMIDPRHIWNVIYNARSNKGCPPTSPNTTAPATKNGSPKFQSNFSKTVETSFAMRSRSDHDPKMKPSVRNPPRQWMALGRLCCQTTPPRSPSSRLARSSKHACALYNWATCPFSAGWVTRVTSTLSKPMVWQNRCTQWLFVTLLTREQTWMEWAPNFCL